MGWDIKSWSEGVMTACRAYQVLPEATLIHNKYDLAAVPTFGSIDCNRARAIAPSPRHLTTGQSPSLPKAGPVIAYAVCLHLSPQCEVYW